MTQSPLTPNDIGLYYQHDKSHVTVRIIRVWNDSVEFDNNGYNQVLLMEDFCRSYHFIDVPRMY